MIEPDEVSQPMETARCLDQTAGGEFLSLDELGKLLSQLASQGLISAFDFFFSIFHNVYLSLRTWGGWKWKGNFFFLHRNTSTSATREKRTKLNMLVVVKNWFSNFCYLTVF